MGVISLSGTLPMDSAKVTFRKSACPFGNNTIYAWHTTPTTSRAKIQNLPANVATIGNVASHRDKPARLLAVSWLVH